MASSNRKFGIHTTKVIDVVNNHRSALIRREGKWEKTRVESVLRQSEDMFRLMAQNSRDIICLHDSEHKYVFISPACKEILGYEPEELVGTNPWELVHPQDLEALQKVGQEKAEKGEPVLLSYRIRKKSGEYIWFESVSRLLKDNKGSTLGFVTSSRDITERKRMEEALRQSEEQYSTLVERSNDGIAIVQDGLIRFVNPKILEIYGFTAGEILGKPFLDFVSPEYRSLVVDRYKKRISGEKVPNIYELEILAKDGSKMPIEINASRIEYQGSPADMIIIRDITERKRMEEALRESEQRYRSLFESTLDGVFVIDAETMKVVLANQAAANIFGLDSAEDGIGVAPLDFIPPDDRDRVSRIIAEDMFANDLRQVNIFRAITRDGREIWIRAVGVRTEYQGRLAGLVSFWDITERKQVEEALRQSEEKYRSLVNHVSFGIFRSTPGPRGRFLEVNPAMERITGYSKEELLQMDVCDLYQHPEERQRVLEEVASVTDITTREMRFRKKDGTEITVSDTKVAVRDDAGQIIYFDGIIEDVTNRRKVEEQIKRAAEEWRTTFDSITDWISIVDKDYKLVRVNKAFADALGKKPKELIGKTCYQVVHETNEPVPDCPCRKTLQTKRPAAVELFEPRLGMYLEMRTSPIFDEKGKVVASVQVARDVTERKRVEEQLMLTHRLASIGELVSGVAHELNNPLTSVIGFSQLLMEREIADDIREDLSLVYSEARRAAGIVKNLLTFARKHPPVKRLTRINNVIEDVLNLRAYWQRVNNIEVRRQLAPDLPEIMVDSVQMQQVFLNITVNAEYFMIQAHNRGTLTITTEKVGNVIRISFGDDGPGIARKNLTRIFDPFFTTKGVGKGTGLGLSICHGIVAEHGGRIYARSQWGEGATFIVELPISSP